MLDINDHNDQGSTRFEASLPSSAAGWLVGCRYKDNCPLVGPEPIEGAPSVGGSF